MGNLFSNSSPNTCDSLNCTANCPPQTNCPAPSTCESLNCMANCPMHDFKDSSSPGANLFWLKTWANTATADSPPYSDITIVDGQFLLNGNPTCISQASSNTPCTNDNLYCSSNGLHKSATEQMKDVFVAYGNGGIHPECPVTESYSSVRNGYIDI